MTRARRGQTLVLFAVTGLLLALAVMLTVAYGRRLHEKLEQQAVADAVAYSQAVATARAFNQLAVVNRTQIAHMVNIATINSVISLSTAKQSAERVSRTTWLTLLGQARAQIQQLLLQAPSANRNRLLCGYREIEAGLSALGEQCPGTCCWGNGPSEPDVFGPLDALAAKQANDRYEATQLLYGQMRGALVDALYGQHFGQGVLAKRIIDESLGRGAALFVPDAGTDVNQRELKTALRGEPFDVDPGSNGWDWKTAHMQIMLGTRDALGYNHEQWAGLIGNEIQNAANSLSHRCVPPPNFSVAATSGGGGSAYFSDRFDTGPEIPAGRFLSDDQVTLSLTVAGGQPVGSPGCSAVMGMSPNPRQAFVASATNSALTIHSIGGPTPEPVEIGRHFVAPAMVDGSMYPQLFDLDPYNITNAPDLFAQPKELAVVGRDYQGQAPRAHELRFDFAGAGRFDDTGRTLKDGTDLSLSLSVSTGLTYYHRRDHYKEPPNLFNPYWRATLVTPAVDRSGLVDLEGTFRQDADPRARVSADLVRALASAGYEGW